MTYDKIFCLDDFPIFLVEVKSIMEKQGASFKDLMSRMSFAHDYREGQELAKSDNFDLYILNCDFPQHLSCCARTQVEAFIEELRNGECHIPNPDRYDEDIPLAFIKFYEENLKEKPVIILTNAHDAALYACKLGLPLFRKNSPFTESDVKAMVDSAWRLRGERLEVSPEWGYGGTEDMVKKYLLKEK